LSIIYLTNTQPKMPLNYKCFMEKEKCIYYNLKIYGHISALCLYKTLFLLRSVVYLQYCMSYFVPCTRPLSLVFWALCIPYYTSSFISFLNLGVQPVVRMINNSIIRFLIIFRWIWKYLMLKSVMPFSCKIVTKLLD
jgi:hypothetical protein